MIVAHVRAALYRTSKRLPVIESLNLIITFRELRAVIVTFGICGDSVIVLT